MLTKAWYKKIHWRHVAYFHFYLVHITAIIFIYRKKYSWRKNNNAERILGELQTGNLVPLKPRVLKSFDLESWETATGCSPLQELEGDCGYNQGTGSATRTFEDVPSRRQSHCSHHPAPRGAGPARRGGRSVDFPSCRPVLLQETEMNDNEVRPREACNEHSGFPLKLQRIGTAGSKIYGRKNCWVGWLSQVLLFTWLTNTFFSNLKKYQVWLARGLSLAGCFPCLPFVLSTDFRRLCTEKNVTPSIFPKYII